jgi:hypothetical protein
MKRMLAGLLALTLMAIVVGIPRPAAAHHRGHFFGGFAVGTFTGVVLGSAFAPRYYYAPPVVVYQPSPVYVAPYPVYVSPAPPATYVPPQWVWNGYGWVLTPGYWR